MGQALKCVLLWSLLLISVCVQAQEKVTLSGTVTDENGLPVIAASIGILGEPGGTVTDESGAYTLEVPVNKKFTLVFRHLSHKTERQELMFEKPGVQTFDFEMNRSAYDLIEIEIEDEEFLNFAIENLDELTSYIIKGKLNIRIHRDIEGKMAV